MVLRHGFARVRAWSTGAMAAAALIAGLAPAAAGPAAPGARCPEGQLRVVDLGVRGLDGQFRMSFESPSQGQPAQPRVGWVFFGEPKVLTLDPAGPAAGRIREGDVIVAVDGHLITTREGGRRFAAIQPGHPVELVVRRAGRTTPVIVVPRWTCSDDGGPLELSGTPAPPAPPAVPELVDVPDAVAPAPGAARAIAPPAARRAPRAPRAARAPSPRPTLVQLGERGWFGVGLDCGECGLGVEDSFVVWRTDEYPVIYSVDPGSPAARAGLQRGDELVKIDGQSLLTPQGARRFGAVKPGQSVKWTFRRDGAERSTVAVAAERPDVTGSYTRSMTRLREELQRRAEELQRRFEAKGERDAEMARLAAELEAALEETPRPEPGGTQRLRYSGAVGDADVEVKGLGNVTVTRDESTGEIVITTADATVRIRPAAKAPRAPRAR